MQPNYFLALAAHHVHQQASFQNGPMDKHWLTVGLLIAIGGAILLTLASAVRKAA